MKKLVGSFLIFFLVSVFGCLPAPQKRVVIPPEPETKIAPLSFSDILDRKIRFFNGVLEENELSEEDKKIASDLLDTYQMLKKECVGHLAEVHCGGTTYDLFQCLSSIDENYFSKKQDMARNYSIAFSLFSNKRNQILDSYLSGDFNAVINQCLELKTSFGPDAITPEIGLLFALSLAKKEMLREAINIGEKITHDLDASPDIINLRASIAVWQLQLGQRDKAISLYEKLVDTLDEQEVVLQSLGRKIAVAGKTAPELEPIPEHKQPEHKVAVQTEGTVDHILQEVEKLVQEHKFSEARDLLLLQRSTVLSNLELEIINQALKDLELAEDNYLDEKISMISVKKEALESARKLLEEEKFEEAISSLDALQSEQEDDVEIRELKEFAIEKLINHERNRAAKIFLTAKETQDPMKKEKYLRSSHEILNTLIDKYPSSPLNQKLKSHIEKVAEELDKLQKNIQ